MSEAVLHGSCLCGSVTYEVSGPFKAMVHCHCQRCRKASGGSQSTNMAVAPGQFSWLKGEEHIGRYELEESRRFGKWFCRQCGSPVPRLTRDGKMVVVPAGSLDEAPPISPSAHIFWGSRAPWTFSSGGLPTFLEYQSGW